MTPVSDRIILLLILLLAIVFVGCLHPDTGRSPETENATLPVHPSPPPTPVNTTSAITRVVTTSTLPPAVFPSPSPGTGQTILYEQHTGQVYAIDYVAGWNSSTARYPLRQYSYSWAGCQVTEAYQLDQEQRIWRSPDGGTVLLASIVSTQRDIWPRGFDGQIVYADIVNSYFGNPDHCANTPDGTFSVTGREDVSVSGVPYRGTRYDFGKINATGFTEGTGTCMIVTGLNTRAVFAIYHSAQDRGIPDAALQHIFNSLRLDSRF